MKAAFIVVLMIITRAESFLPTLRATSRHLSSRPRFAALEDGEEMEMKALFNIIDADGNGGIDNREMTVALSKVGILGPELQTIALSKVDMPGVSSAEVDKMFSEADENGDGIIELAEFATIYKKLKAMADAA